MELQDALEYLNLPANSSRQLVRKRYLELKKDYLKAINNAPSDHFGALYRENLDKIEEAYTLLIATADAAHHVDIGIQNSIQETSELIDSFLKQGGTLTSERKEKIKQYIDEINRLQKQLRSENPGIKGANIILPSQKWDLNHRKEQKVKSSKLTHHQFSSSNPREQSDDNSSSKWRWEIKSFPRKFPLESNRKKQVKESGGEQLMVADSGLKPQSNNIQSLVRLSISANNWFNKSLHHQVVKGAILLVLLLVIIGIIYLFYPLVFP
jgi:hypothetical protein